VIFCLLILLTDSSTALAQIESLEQEIKDLEFFLRFVAAPPPSFSNLLTGGGL
jgi:hypothetical protein